MTRTIASSTSRWLPPQQAADYLGCSRNFLDKDRSACLHGIPFARLGRHIRYDRADLDAFLERTKTQPNLDPQPGEQGGQS